MGSGKSYWHQSWAQGLSPGEISFDFDRQIFSRTNPGEWIEQNGWPSFRRLERELLQKTLSSGKSGLFALGGGALEGGGLELLRAHARAKLVWIDTPAEVCWQRLNHPKARIERPGLSDSLAQFKILYHSRLPNYQRADVILSEGQCRSITWEKLKTLVRPKAKVL